MQIFLSHCCFYFFCCRSSLDLGSKPWMREVLLQFQELNTRTNKRDSIVSTHLEEGGGGEEEAAVRADL
jgi:hypothetical protein